MKLSCWKEKKKHCFCNDMKRKFNVYASLIGEPEEFEEVDNRTLFGLPLRAYSLKPTIVFVKKKNKIKTIFSLPAAISEKTAGRLF